jgi:hypothetical protein
VASNDHLTCDTHGDTKVVLTEDVVPDRVPESAILEKGYVSSWLSTVCRWRHGSESLTFVDDIEGIKVLGVTAHDGIDVLL